MNLRKPDLWLKILFLSAAVLILYVLFRFLFGILVFLLLVLSVSFTTLFLSGLIQNLQREKDLKKAYSRTVEDLLTLLREVLKLLKKGKS